MAERNPNLISPKAMEAIASTAGSGRELISEIFTKINNAKDKPKKIEVLRKHDTPGMRMLLKGAFDPNSLPDPAVLAIASIAFGDMRLGFLSAILFLHIYVFKNH